MKQRFVFLTVAALCVDAVQAQTPPRFMSRSELVTVDVLVMNGRRPVTGLTLADFELLDNGVPQSLQQLYLEQLPLNLIMVLDVSFSVEGERLTSLKKGAASVVDRLRPSDRAAVVSFSHRLGLQAALTSDRERLKTSIAALEPSGSTALRDAAYAGLALRATSQARTLLLLFSDGVDTSSVLEERRVLEIARRSDVIVYAIGVRGWSVTYPIGSSTRPVRVPSGPVTDDRFLSGLAAETGGRLVYAENDRDVAETFTRVMQEFNSRYVLGYAPKGVPDSGWHQLTVRVKNRNATVLARRGYSAEERIPHP
jgi:Ca-activated chloride channel homolog